MLRVFSRSRLSLDLGLDISCMPMGRALARILKLPVTLERVPVTKVHAARETQVERAVAREPSWVGSRGPPLGPWWGPGAMPRWGSRGQSPRKL